MSRETEEWREVAGFPGYFVSDHGRFRKGDRVLRGCNSIGYRQFTMRDANGKTFRKYAHRLVLESFVGPCPDGMEGCHAPDKDTENNALWNLRWDTHKSNVADRSRDCAERKAARLSSDRRSA